MTLELKPYHTKPPDARGQITCSNNWNIVTALHSVPALGRAPSLLRSWQSRTWRDCGNTRCGPASTPPPRSPAPVKWICNEYNRARKRNRSSHASLSVTALSIQKLQDSIARQPRTCNTMRTYNTLTKTPLKYKYCTSYLQIRFELIEIAVVCDMYAHHTRAALKPANYWVEPPHQFVPEGRPLVWVQFGHFIGGGGGEAGVRNHCSYSRKCSRLKIVYT